MNKIFNRQQIAQIAIQVRQFKKLYVTTEGQMFTNEADADEAVRTKNAIIDEPDSYVGIAKITDDMVTNEHLKTFAKDAKGFGKLFDEAKVPRSVDTKPQHERKRETVKTPDKETVDSVSAALGLKADAALKVNVEVDVDDTDDEADEKPQGNVIPVLNVAPSHIKKIK